MKPFKILVVTQPGLEEFSAAEIRALGYHDLKLLRGGIFLVGHLNTVVMLNLACRTISRVLIEAGGFEAYSFSQLEHHLKNIDWKDYLGDRQACIRVSSYKSDLYHEKAISERVINSISDNLGKTVALTGSPDVENTQLIVVHAQHDHFTIRIDSSGAHLHKRGYGICKEEAPLRETIASAMLNAAGWITDFSSLCDPMCGSGTIPIEAALMAKKIPLSVFRDFSFMEWQSYQPEVYDKVHNALMDRVVSSPEIRIRAADIDDKSIQSARANADKAGIKELIDFGVTPLAKNVIDRNFSVITNPPWGKRIDDLEILSVWKSLTRLAQQDHAVHLLLPDFQEEEFRSNFRTLLSFNSGNIKVKFIRLEV